MKKEMRCETEGCNALANVYEVELGKFKLLCHNCAAKKSCVQIPYIKDKGYRLRAVTENHTTDAHLESLSDGKYFERFTWERDNIDENGTVWYCVYAEWRHQVKLSPINNFKMSEKDEIFKLLEKEHKDNFETGSEDLYNLNFNFGSCDRRIGRDKLKQLQKAQTFYDNINSIGLKHPKIKFKLSNYNVQLLRIGLGPIITGRICGPFNKKLSLVFDHKDMHIYLRLNESTYKELLNRSSDLLRFQVESGHIPEEGAFAYMFNNSASLQLNILYYYFDQKIKQSKLALRGR